MPDIKFGIAISFSFLSLAIGFGRIAKEVAKRAELLGMNVIYTDIMGEAQGFNNYKFCDME
ncbi:NAD(P)-dependent oxidoreductase, partial [Clostridioides difficile]